MLSKNDAEKLMNDVLRHLVKYIANKYNISVNEAMNRLLKTITYSMIVKRSTKIYLESRVYLEKCIDMEFSNKYDELERLLRQ